MICVYAFKISDKALVDSTFKACDFIAITVEAGGKEEIDVLARAVGVKGEVTLSPDAKYYEVWKAPVSSRPPSLTYRIQDNQLYWRFRDSRQRFRPLSIPWSIQSIQELLNHEEQKRKAQKEWAKQRHTKRKKRKVKQSNKLPTELAKRQNTAKTKKNERRLEAKERAEARKRFRIIYTPQGGANRWRRR